MKKITKKKLIEVLEDKPLREMRKLEKEGKAEQVWEVWAIVAKNSKKEANYVKKRLMKLMKVFGASKVSMRFAGWAVPKDIETNTFRIRGSGKYDLVPWINPKPPRR